jgi:hypothetical protein
MVVGVPALRIKGLFLAVTTLAFAIALDNYFLNQNTFPQFVKTSVKRPLLWERFNMADNYDLYLVTLAFLVVSILLSIGVRKSRSGRVLIGTRDNQRAADAASVPTTNIKLSGFLLAGAIAGVAGTLNVMAIGGLAVGTFNPADSITVFSTTVIGGLGSITGAIRTQQRDDLALGHGEVDVEEDLHRSVRHVDASALQECALARRHRLVLERVRGAHRAAPTGSPLRAPRNKSTSSLGWSTSSSTRLSARRLGTRMPRRAATFFSAQSRAEKRS